MSIAHVEAAGRERARAGGEALPVGPSGVVEVHVRIDQAGQDEQPGRVDRLPRLAQLTARRDLGDHAVGDRHVDGAAAHDRVEAHATLLR